MSVSGAPYPFTFEATSSIVGTGTINVWDDAFVRVYSDNSSTFSGDWEIERTTFQFVHPFVEEFSDPWPAEFNDEDQDRQGNRRDNQNRLDTDAAALVRMDSLEQAPEGRHRRVVVGGSLG